MKKLKSQFKKVSNILLKRVKPALNTLVSAIKHTNIVHNKIIKSLFFQFGEIYQ